MEDKKLTNREMEILSDREFMPMKHRICEKIERSLADLHERLQAKIQDTEGIPGSQKTGKISRGENYLTYAYRVLDFPAVFEKENIFTFRSLVLWGHHISFHLILSGQYKDTFQDALWNRKELIFPNALLDQREDPWNWLPDSNILTNLSELKDKHSFSKHSFLKISHYLDLQEFEKVGQWGEDIWQAYQKALS